MKQSSSYTTDIILIDVISFSQLTADQQLEIITFLTKSYSRMIEAMLVNSEMTLKKMVLGFISTGDGFYCILNPRLKGFGAILGLSFNHFAEQISEKYPYFKGIRVAVHTGNIYTFTDILGHNNFVGDGLNECARYIEIKNYTISTVVVSQEAYNNFEGFLQRHRDFYTLLTEHQFKRSKAYTFVDKHNVSHLSYMIWLRKGGIINPPIITFNTMLQD